ALDRPADAVEVPAGDPPPGHGERPPGGLGDRHRDPLEPPVEPVREALPRRLVGHGPLARRSSFGTWLARTAATRTVNAASAQSAPADPPSRSARPTSPKRTARGPTPSSTS